MDRREFLSHAVGVTAVGAGLCAYTPRAWARSSIDLGQVQIDSISDGFLALPKTFLFADPDDETLVSVLERHGIADDVVEMECNLTILRDGERTVLFDVGAGPNFMPSAGKVLSGLETLDIDPSQVTHVAFTHAHPDHLWGLLDEFEDLVFPEAEYLISMAEWDYWTDPETVTILPDERKPFAVGAARNLSVIEERITRFKAGAEILNGVHALATPGHTPGHTSFEVRSGNDSVMIVGDAIANAHVAFEYPKLESGTDQDPNMGAETRASLLDLIATDRMRIIGYHLPNGGVGAVEKSGAGYRFVHA